MSAVQNHSKTNFLTVHRLSALSFQGYPGLDGSKGETGAVGSKVGFYCSAV